MKWKICVALILVAAIAIIGFGSQQAEGETDPFIDQVLYSRNTLEEITIVQSGRDNATYYRYLIIDDYTDSPENWSQPGFNDSTLRISWVLVFRVTTNQDLSPCS